MSRPSDAHVGRPAAYVDKLLIEGKGGVHHIWACDHYKTTLNAIEFKRVYKQRTDMVKDAMSAVPYGDRAGDGRRDHGRDPAGRPVRGRRRHRADQDRPGLPRLAAGRDLGRDEPDLDERRAAHAAHRALHGPAGPGDARLPDRGADRQPPGARLPRAWARTTYADQFKGFDWQTEEDAFMDGYHKNAEGGEFVTYDRLRAMGTNGFQEPATGFEDGKIVGTKRLYADGKFGSKDGKATFMETQWRGLQAPGKQEEKDKFAVPDQQRPHQPRLAERLSRSARTSWSWTAGPIPFIEMNPDDMAELGAQGGRSGRGLQRQRLDPGDGLSDADGEAKGDLHAVRLPDRRAGQRRLAGRERVHHPELQADLGATSGRSPTRPRACGT